MTTARVVPPLALLLACLLALLALLTPYAAAQGAAAVRPLEIAVNDLVVGDRGYAITAAAGNVLERFDITVLGVQHGAANGFPLVLVRASGPLIDEAGGVAAGMSGSPVYISTERGYALLGAIGYVFPEADHSVALVTPIEVMRRADGAATFALNVPGYGAAAPVTTPVLLAGATSRTAQLLAPLFDAAGLQLLPMQAAGVATPLADADFRLEPGSAVAVALIQGDVSMSAVGTVTTIEGERLLAFGHPFLGLGEASLPIVPAYVTAILPSRQVPFKLANVGALVLGSVDQDRPGGVAGGLGLAPETVSVSLSLLGVPGAPRHTFEVAADERLYPVLVATAALQLLDRALGATTPGHAELAWEISLAGGERVNVLEQVNHSADIAYGAGLMAGGPLALLASNDFRAADVSHVSISMTLNADQQVASIEEAVLEADEVAPGAAAHVHLRLQPYRQQAQVRTITVPIPEDLTGPVTLLIRGGSVPRDTGDLDLDEEEINPPRTFGELLQALRERVQSSELVVEAVTADGELLRLLRTPMPFVVLGHERVSVDVVGEPE